MASFTTFQQASSIRILVFLVGFSSFNNQSFSQELKAHWQDEILSICQSDGHTDLCFMSPSILNDNKWHELPQPMFWKKIMRLSPDSCIINFGRTREIIAIKSVKEWNTLTDDQKNSYRDSVRQVNGFPADEKIYMTTGKNDFYKFSDVIPTITRGIEVFNENNVDPWYAQAILLIESPGKLAKSTVGAYGPFQLMKSVAIKQGLTVNDVIDERKDFDRSAWAAGKLIKNVCIPEAKKMLSSYNISYHEKDLWFRLFVLHIYHAGSGNVNQVMTAIQPSKGGQELITQMWQTKAGHFGNASQNYSQLALASLIVLSELFVGM
jgi:hypothetical protein